MRPLSARAAQRCEDAVGKRCKCRCGGEFHGARRGWVGSLATGDPHRPARAWLQLTLDLDYDVARLLTLRNRLAAHERLA